jgi:hypothetical protein
MGTTQSPILWNEALTKGGAPGDPGRQRRPLPFAEPMNKHVAKPFFGGPIARKNRMAAHAGGDPGHHALDLLITKMAGADVHDVVGVSHGTGDDSEHMFGLRGRLS